MAEAVTTAPTNMKIMNCVTRLFMATSSMQ